MVAEDDKNAVEGVKQLSELLIESTEWFDGKPHLTPEQEDALQWAKDFMDRYEKKRRINFRTEEPLKGYRQCVFDELVARAKANGVI